MSLPSRRRSQLILTSSICAVLVSAVLTTIFGAGAFLGSRFYGVLAEYVFVALVVGGIVSFFGASRGQSGWFFVVVATIAPILGLILGLLVFSVVFSIPGIEPNLFNYVLFRGLTIIMGILAGALILFVPSALAKLICEAFS